MDAPPEPAAAPIGADEMQIEPSVPYASEPAIGVEVESIPTPPAQHSANVSAQTQSPDASLLANLTTPFSRHLGRNRACQSCRQRKLKCDGQKPICGQCSRAWSSRKRSLKGKGLTEEMLLELEKPCEYVDVPETSKRAQNRAEATRVRSASRKGTGEGSATTALQQAERENRLLQKELSDLKARITATSAQQNFQPNQDELSIAEVLASTMRTGEGASAADTSFTDSFNGNSFSSFVEGLAQRANAYTQEEKERARDAQIDPLLLDQQGETEQKEDGQQADPLMELISNSWPADFPPPAMVDTLVHIFFDGFAHLRCLFHKGRFFRFLAEGPTSRNYPHPAVLHAMFSLAYILRPDLDRSGTSQSHSQHQTEDILDSYIRHRFSDVQRHPDPAYRAGQQQGVSLALGSRNDRERGKLGSAGFHSERAQFHIQAGLWEGGDLVSIAKAGMILTMKRYACGEVFDAWMSSGMCTRLTVALGLNRESTTLQKDDLPAAHKTPGAVPIDTVRLAMAGPPNDWIEAEERRRLMYMILATDRSATASTLWSKSLDDDQVSLEFPLYSNAAFEDASEAEPPQTDRSRRQTLHSSDLFTSNHIDGYNTMLKSVILMGRISSLLSNLPAFATEADLLTSEFHKLDNALSAFALSLPFQATELDERGHADPFRFATYMVINTNTVLLHGPLMRIRGQSAAMCEAACQAILNLVRVLIAAATEFARLPPLVIVCLSTTGKTLVRQLQIMRGQATLQDGKSNSGFQNGDLSTGSAFNSDRLDIGIDTSMGPFAYSFSYMPMSNTAAGMGGPSASRSTAQLAKEDQLRADIDLIFTYLGRMGQTWAMARRQAQHLAQMLGIETASPEALQHGLFTERNHSTHKYQQQQQQPTAPELD